MNSHFNGEYSESLRAHAFFFVCRGFVFTLASARVRKFIFLGEGGSCVRMQCVITCIGVSWMMVRWILKRFFAFYSPMEEAGGLEYCGIKLMIGMRLVMVGESIGKFFSGK